MERLAKKDEKPEFSYIVAAEKMVVLTPYGNVLIPAGTAILQAGIVQIPLPVWLLDKVTGK